MVETSNELWSILSKYPRTLQKGGYILSYFYYILRSPSKSIPEEWHQDRLGRNTHEGQYFCRHSYMKECRQIPCYILGRPFQSLSPSFSDILLTWYCPFSSLVKTEQLRRVACLFLCSCVKKSIDNTLKAQQWHKHDGKGRERIWKYAGCFPWQVFAQ